jgi:hypothetical protein
LTIWIFLIQIYGRPADYLSEVQYSLTGQTGLKWYYFNPLISSKLFPDELLYKL